MIMKEKKQDKLSVNEPNSIGEALSHSRHQVPSSALESQRQKVSKMTMKEKIDQMILNNECVPDLKDCLSYSSSDPTKFFFVKTDNAFTRKARVLQAIRRWQTGADCGYIVKNEVRYYHPNLATDGKEINRNFLHHEIFDYAKQRVLHKKRYETINEKRLFNNFLSSQPMAFNLFVPLMVMMQSDEGQVRLAKTVSSLMDKSYSLGINRITEVGIEFIPEYYKECLNDKTAMDAYFRFEKADGGKGIIAIETKYTDVLGKNQASDPAPAIEAATKREGICGLFTNQGKEDILMGRIELCQVYRNFLLTECVRLHEHLEDSLSVVLSPKNNTANTDDEQQLKDILNANYKYKFQTINLEDFTEALMEEFPDEDIFKRFHHRYLDFRQAERLLATENK